MSNVVIPYRFVVKRETAAHFTSENTLLLQGEWALELDTGKMKMGDGSTAWNSLPYKTLEVATPCLQFTTDTSSTADSDNGPGLTWWDNATQSSATKLFFDDATADTGTDLSAYFTELAASSATGILHMVAEDGSFKLYKFTSIADGTGYFKFTVSHLVSSGGNFADGITVRVVFHPIPTGGGGGGYSQGTTFPGSPSTNDKFYRTDLNLLCYYDGTRWLTVQVFETAAIPGTSLMPYSATRLANLRFALRQDFGIYMTRFNCQTFVSGTSNGSNYWTVAFEWANAANSATSIVSFITASDTASNWTNHDQVIGSVLNSSARNMQVSVTKTGSPGDLYDPCSFCYRLIVT
jgi:hypothetical protein